MEDIGHILNEIAIPIDLTNSNDLKMALNSCVGTKFADRWGTLIVDLALKACQIVLSGTKNSGKLNVEIKRYAKIEKIPGGTLEESRVLNGVMFNKDITHPSMRW